ncbi:hypothetical protein BHJ80_06565 [Escherichia coli]|nr:hypothetical protein BHJ80_06565 [Escherichia coli]
MPEDDRIKAINEIRMAIHQVSPSRRAKISLRVNRARGRHQITAMSEIVRELSQLGWDDNKIGKELGMDSDEVLRLKQINGLQELFIHDQYSRARG